MDSYHKKLKSLIDANYSSSGLLEYDFFSDFYQFAKAEEHLGDRLKGINVYAYNEDLPSSMASYDFITRYINVYTDPLYYDIAKIQQGAFYDGNMSFVYLLALQTLLHEVEHIKQTIMIALEKDDFESRLVTICNPKMSAIVNPNIRLNKSISFKKTNNENDVVLYYCNPLERLAEIRSTEKVIGVSNLFGKSTLHITDFLKLYLIANQSNGYKLFKNPTKAFLTDVGTVEEYSEFEQLGSGFDDYTRNQYGLEVSNAFFDSLESRRVKILSKYNR